MRGAKHTPGEWTQGARGPNGCPIVGTSRGLMVAQVAHTTLVEDQREEAEANAALIAAAPDLLEALDTLTLVLGLTAIKHAHQMPPLQEAWNMARAAIKKARGES